MKSFNSFLEDLLAAYKAAKEWHEKNLRSVLV